MSPRVFRVLIGLSGVAGVLLLGTSFSINNGPPPGATTAQLVAFSRHYFLAIVWGAWLQAVGTILTVVFALGVVYLAGATNRFAGWLTLFGGAILTTVSLVEIVFYFGALFPDPETMVVISPNFGHATQHLYFIAAAPALFLPLGAVIIATPLLPRAFGYLALLLGAAFSLAGIISLTRLIVPNGETALAGIQALWWLAAALALIVREGKAAGDKPSAVS